MSSLAISSSITAALPAVNVHPHGHKKGSPLDLSPDSGSSTAAQIPVGSAQNLFGKAFSALEQLIGLQPPPAPSSPAAAAGNPAAPSTNSTAASIAAEGSKINLFA
jgi:hypothetical protein